MLTEKSFDTGEVVINYAEGDTDGPPLLMLHALTHNWQTLSELIPALEPRWHLYAPDLRGHRPSGWAASGYQMVDVARDVTALMEQVIRRPAVVLGFSFGATVALLLPARLPKLTRALVSLEPGLLLWEMGIRGAAGPYELLRLYDEIVTASRTRDDFVANVRRRMPELDEAGVQGQVDWISRLDPALITCVLNDESIGEFDLTAVLRQVACPTLLVYGESELGGMVRASDAALFQACVPQARLAQVKGAGHAVCWPPASSVTLAHVTQFLDSL